MIHDFVIIGGGVAGLSAAIRLTELGAEPLLIEGGTYPTHKICGEFLSPECIPYLTNWNIDPITVFQTQLRTSSNHLSFIFPEPAGSLSHIQLDPCLADYAKNNKAHILTNTQVTTFNPKSHLQPFHEIHLSTTEIIKAKQVIIATGRIPNLNTETPTMRYMGIKAHFKGIPLHNTLEMFSFPGAYLGISPVENESYNIACLAKLDLVKKHKCPEAFMDSLLSLHPLLKSYIKEGIKLFPWMSHPIPKFGFKSTPQWLDTFFIGDAAMSIPPVCGNGLSLALIGGNLAAEYAIQKRAHDFKWVWRKRCSSQMMWAKLLNHTMLHPALANQVMGLAKYFPSLSTKIYSYTRQIT